MTFDDDNRDTKRRHAQEPPIEGWELFAAELHSRLVVGRAAYGDASFRRPPAELVGELEQEALDVAGWGYILWMRLRALRTRVELAGAVLDVSGKAPAPPHDGLAPSLCSFEAPPAEPSPESAPAGRVGAAGLSADCSDGGNGDAGRIAGPERGSP